MSDPRINAAREPHIVVEDLTMAYGDFVIQHDLNFTINKRSVNANFPRISARAHARESAAAIHMISLAFLTAWGQLGASGCRTINHWELGARKPYGARLFGVFALV